MRQLLATLFASFVITTISSAQPASARPVTFAYQTPTLNGTLPLIVGIDFGFFAAEGLEVKTVFIRGGPTAIAALVGGDVDYTVVAGVPAVRAIVQGAPVTIVSGMQPYMDYTLIGAKGINQLNDLKGKIVGVTGAGGIAEYAAVEGLAKKGMVRDRDYKILYGVGNSPARAQSLEAGRIHASPFSFLERIELEQKGFPVLFEIGKVLPGFPFVVIISSKRKVETDPEGVTALLRGMKRGLDFLRSDKEKVAAAIIRKTSSAIPRRCARPFTSFPIFTRFPSPKKISTPSSLPRASKRKRKSSAARRNFSPERY